MQIIKFFSLLIVFSLLLFQCASDDPPDLSFDDNDTIIVRDTVDYSLFYGTWNLTDTNSSASTIITFASPDIFTGYNPSHNTDLMFEYGTYWADSDSIFIDFDFVENFDNPHNITQNGFLDYYEYEINNDTLIFYYTLRLTSGDTLYIYPYIKE